MGRSSGEIGVIRREIGGHAVSDQACRPCHGDDPGDDPGDHVAGVSTIEFLGNFWNERMLTSVHSLGCQCSNLEKHLLWGLCCQQYSLSVYAFYVDAAVVVCCCVNGGLHRVDQRILATDPGHEILAMRVCASLCVHRCNALQKCRNPVPVRLYRIRVHSYA